MTRYSPPYQRRPVQAAASETAIRAWSWLNLRRAPSRLATAFGHPLGRVGVEGADDGGVGERAGVPAEHRRGRLVHVDDVEAPGAQLAAHLEHGAGEGGQVGDGAVGAVADGASQRDQVVGAASPLGRRAVERSAEAVGRVPRSQHAQLVAPVDQRLCERLDVAVDAAGVSPRVGRDDRDPQRVAPTARGGGGHMDSRYGQLRNPGKARGRRHDAGRDRRDRPSLGTIPATTQVTERIMPVSKDRPGAGLLRGPGEAGGSARRAPCR